MATIAEQLIGSALQFSQKGPDALGALKTGAELAQAAESIRGNREKLELAKQEAQVAKADKIMSAIEKGSQFKDKAAQNLFFKNYVPGMVKALKMEEFFSPELMEYVQASPEVRNKLIGLRLDIQDKVNKGELKGAAIFDYARDRLTPEELPLLDTDSLLEQQKFAASEENKTKRTEMVQTAQTGRQQTQIGSAGQVEQSKRANDLFTVYKASGGEAGTKSRIKKLEDVRDALVKNKIKFGTLGKNIPYGSSLEVLARTDPDAKAAIDTVRSSINVKMRTGDPNPTQNQIDQIYNQAIDPRLDNQTNIEKLNREIEAERMAEKTSLELFRANGIKVAPPTDWRAKVKAQASQVKKLKPADQNKYFKALAEKLNVPLEDIKKELGF